MVGLGAGARSYTDQVHYSTEYAVGATTIKSIIQAYIDRDPNAHETVDYGCPLDLEDRQRRYILLSLLSRPGLDLERYEARFGSSPLADVPALSTLVEHRLATLGDNRMALTAAGLERSDAIGPWLYSARIRRLMGEYRLR